MDRLPALGDAVHRAEMDAAHRGLGGRKLHDLEPLARGPAVRVPGDDLKPVLGRVVLRDRRRQRPLLTADDLSDGVEGRTDDTGHLWLVGDDSAACRETDGGQGLLDDLDLGHVVLALYEMETPLHVDESSGCDPVLLLNLCATD